jgi:hypothetical protein
MPRKAASLWFRSFRPLIEQLESRELLNATPDQQVTRFYGDLLGRKPDPAGLSFWSGQLQATGNAATVVASIEATPEFLGRFVDQQFQQFLGRSADTQAKQYFVRLLQSGSNVANIDKRILDSTEFTVHAAVSDDAGFVDAAYQSILGRKADADGRNYFLTQLMNHAGRNAIIGSILGSSEFALSTVNGLYRQFLGRPAGNQESSLWLGQLQEEGSPFSIIAQILGSPEYAFGQLHVSRPTSSDYTNPSAVLSTGGWRPYIHGDTYVEADFTLGNIYYGMVSATIWWGDGTSDTVSGGGEESDDPYISLSQIFHHSYGTAGTYTVWVMGLFTGPDDVDPYYFAVTLTVADIPPDYPVNCQCAGDIIQTNTGDDGEQPKDTSDDPVRYNDGVAQITAQDLMSNGFGDPWGLTRSWSNNSAYSLHSFNGNGWVDTQQPFLLELDSDTALCVVSNATTARYFTLDPSDPTNNTFDADYFDQSKIFHDVADHVYILTDEMGDQISFYDFSTAVPARGQGQFKSFVDPVGDLIYATTLTGDDLPGEIQRSATSGGVTVTESFVYGYTPGHSGDPLLYVCDRAAQDRQRRLEQCTDGGLHLRRSRQSDLRSHRKWSGIGRGHGFLPLRFGFARKPRIRL